MQAQPATGHRHVKELGGGGLGQAQQVSEPPDHGVVEALELRLEWAQVAERVLDLGVHVRLERPHHLVPRQPRLH
jgi:hypothetical protein